MLRFRVATEGWFATKFRYHALQNALLKDKIRRNQFVAGSVTSTYAS
jgi:hypothetical protein